MYQGSAKPTNESAGVEREGGGEGGGDEGDGGKPERTRGMTGLYSHWTTKPVPNPLRKKPRSIERRISVRSKTIPIDIQGHRWQIRPTDQRITPRINHGDTKDFGCERSDGRSLAVAVPP